MLRTSGRFFSGRSHIFNNQLFQLSSSWNPVKIIHQTAAWVIFGAGEGALQGEVGEGLESLPAPETGT